MLDQHVESAASCHAAAMSLAVLHGTLTLKLVTECTCVCGAQSFLQKALMPLHKPKCVGMYHQQLAYCVTQARRAPRSAHQLA